jgi:ABC-type multidrug transport system fused ATPase/permease subunit
MDADRILVLDAARVSEFDTPWALLSKEGSALKALVDGSGDRKKLYTMAEDAAKARD